MSNLKFKNVLEAYKTAIAINGNSLLLEVAKATKVDTSNLLVILNELVVAKTQTLLRMQELKHEKGQVAYTEFKKLNQLEELLGKETLNAIEANMCGSDRPALQLDSIELLEKLAKALTD